ncbi:YncE family protein [Bosea sp. 117]|uniref:YncE family protein n=1 Tax=Bosea sp. 117 TaxID=1125973 RepID=UPI00049497E3|nr:YncE family protein [Bosea sp. 117]
MSSRRILVSAVAALALLATPVLAEPALVTSSSPGTGLYEVVVSDALGRVYVAAVGERGKDNGAILALDPATLAVKETIELGKEPGFGLGINDKTKTLYATQTRSGAVAAIDLATGKVVATIKQGDKAHVRQVLVDEEANRVYVSAFARGEIPSEIWVIDGATNTIIGTIGDLKGGVSGLALDPKNKRLFVTAMQSNEVHAIDLATGKVIASVPSGGKSPINLAYDAEGDRLFVANQESGDLTVLNARDGALLATIPTGDGALGVSVDPKRGIVYVANRRGGFVSLVDAKELKVIANIVTGSMPNTVAIDEASGRAYVTNKIKTGPRPPRPEGASAGSPPPRPAPMIDPNGDVVTIVTP